MTDPRVSRRAVLRGKMLPGPGYECPPVCETVAVKDQSSYVQWQPNSHHLIHLR